MDVLFVNPPSPDGAVYIRDICRRGRKSHERMIWPQTCLAYPAAVLEKAGYKVDIVDCIAEAMPWHTFEAYVKKKKPGYIVTHFAEPTLYSDARVAGLAKSIGAKSIAIGPHVTGVTLETMREFPDLDFIARNEIDESIQELVFTCENGRSFESVQGIAFRQDGEIVITNDRPQIQGLDSLPFPLHNKLPLHKHRMPLIGSHYTYVLTSRGCPYPCTFCVESVLSWRKVRIRSAESIIAELLWLKELGVTNILFQADLFTIKRDWVVELCTKMLENKLGIRWTCNSRVDTVDEELLKLMKEAGCWLIAYGVESGSQLVLDNCKKKTTVAQIEGTIRASHRVGIKNWGYFIIGLPGESEETIQETIDLSKKLPFDIALFHVAAPYIGTPFYQQAKEQGWLVSEDYEAFDMNDAYNISYPNLSAGQIERGIKRAFREWYARPKVIYNLLRSAGGLEYIAWFAKTGWENLRWSKTVKDGSVKSSLKK